MILYSICEFIENFNNILCFLKLLKFFLYITPSQLHKPDNCKPNSNLHEIRYVRVRRALWKAEWVKIWPCQNIHYVYKGKKEKKKKVKSANRTDFIPELLECFTNNILSYCFSFEDEDFVQQEIDEKMEDFLWLNFDLNFLLRLSTWYNVSCLY